MRLMRWLTACRSLKSVEDGPSPYRMTQQNLVPRFGQVKSAAAASGVAIGKSLRRWFLKLVIEPWRPAMAKAKTLCRPPKLTGRRRRIKAPVQPELLLDTVRVVRNDLRDEDLMASGKAMYAGPGPGAGAGRAWGRITSRIFGPGQSVR